MSYVEWSDLDTDDRHTLVTNIGENEAVLELLYEDHDLRLFESENDFWSWFLDRESIVDVFHDLLWNGDAGALQHGSVHKYALISRGAIPLKKGRIAFLMS